MRDVRREVYNIVADVFSLRVQEIDPGRSWEELGADSFDLVEFIVALGERFELEIDPAELGGVKSINDVVRFVEDRTRSGLTGGGVFQAGV